MLPRRQRRRAVLSRDLVRTSRRVALLVSMEACVLDVAGGRGGAALCRRGAAKAGSLLLHAAVCHILWSKGQLPVYVLSAPHR